MQSNWLLCKVFQQLHSFVDWVTFHQILCVCVFLLNCLQQHYQHYRGWSSTFFQFFGFAWMFVDCSAIRNGITFNVNYFESIVINFRIIALPLNGRQTLPKSCKTEGIYCMRSIHKQMKNKNKTNVHAKITVIECSTTFGSLKKHYDKW